jgi:hypothetical protein
MRRPRVGRRMPIWGFGGIGTPKGFGGCYIVKRRKGRE